MRLSMQAPGTIVVDICATLARSPSSRGYSCSTAPFDAMTALYQS